MIVKVQIPLFSNNPNVGCLVYPESRKRTVEQTITPATFKALRGDKKGYFAATWNDAKRRYTILNRVEEQDW